MPKVVIPRPENYRYDSPCYDALGNEYHLCVVWDRHPYVKDAPLRTHGTSHTSRDLAHAAAREAWTQAYISLLPSHDVRSRAAQSKAAG